MFNEILKRKSCDIAGKKHEMDKTRAVRKSDKNG